jgi:raffinose/stachyose/melibiose transport system substrate-binding protein
MKRAGPYIMLINAGIVFALILTACASAPAATTASAATTAPTAVQSMPTAIPTIAPTAVPTEHPPLTISFWSVSNGQGWLDAYKSACVAYKVDHPYFNCDIQVTTNGFAELTANLTAGNGPDIFHLSGSRLAIAPYVTAKQMLPLTNLDYVKNAPAAVTGPWTFNGEVYGAAIDNWSAGLYYNTDIFNKLNIQPPTSFPELLSACDQIKKAGIVPIAPMYADSWTAGLVATLIAGTTVMAPEPDWFSKRVAGQTTFAADPGWQKVVQEMDQMNKEGCYGSNPLSATSTNYTDGQNMFIAGKAAMWIQGTWAAGDMVTKGADASKIQLITFPASDNPGESYTSIAIGNAFSVNPKGKDPEEAKQFLNFLYTNEDLVKQFAAFNGGFTLFDPKASSADQQPMFKTFVKQFYGDKIAAWPADYMIGGTQVNISDLLQGMMAGAKKPGDVLTELDTDWNTYQSEHPEVVTALK